ncbi:membrane protein DedA with SNARE-associated domain [Kitasatospora sp. MAP12-15]|uniref:DedA family protein n=1 Tax=unclassified Kitasatospora TaxID=2633591 RepID=UPI0024730060|nr:DedA family protein [Kitasatospora sp. MAP12-44]MDH6108730.1 membrane protein DedA with SNARE-associated domain [Kitasatospora sp. MAP12-44]
MTTPVLPGALAPLAPLLENYGYLAVGTLVFLDNCLVPVPGQTVMIAAAVYAGAGRLSIAAVVAVALTAAIAGNSLGYLIGRSGGRAFVHRYGRYVLLTPERFAKAEGFFQRNGGKVVVVARFIDGLRQTSGALAGISGMRWRRFLAFNTLGAVLWVGVWSGLGYAAGTDIGPIYRQAIRFQVYLLILVGAVVLVLLIRYLLRRRRAPE